MASQPKPLHLSLPDVQVICSCSLLEKEKGVYVIDHADEAVRGMLVVEDGSLTWPPPAPEVPAAAAATPAEAKEELPVMVVDPRDAYMSSAMKVNKGVSERACFRLFV